MRLLRHLLYEKPDDTGGGGSNPPTDNLVGEARRKQGEAEARARAAERERDEFRQRLEALEGEGASELQKAQKKIATLEAERDTLRSTLTTNEKQKHVRAVASAFNPHDTEALFKFVDLDTIDSEDAAKNALEGLKQTHAFLFNEGNNAPGPQPTPTPFGAPVPAGGVPVQPAVPLKPDGTPDVQQGIGMGLLGALDRFRTSRASEQ